MIETIKKYVTGRKQISVAKNLLKEFSPSKGRQTLNPLKLYAIDLENFGHIEGHNEEYGNVTLVCGPRGSGKSTYLEAPRWLLSNLYKMKANVAGILDDASGGSLKFGVNGTKYVIDRWSTKGKNSVELKDSSSGETISGAINETTARIRDVVGIDMDLFASTVFYSPRSSFQFSRRLPNEIEKLIIRILNLDAWLDLERHSKKIREEEDDKIHELDGVIGYATKKGLTRKEIEEQVKINATDKKKFEADLKKIEVPDIKELNEQSNIAKAELTKYENLVADIETHSSVVEMLAKRKAKVAELEEDRDIQQGCLEGKDNDFDADAHEKLEDEVADITATGKSLKKDIEKLERTKVSGTCPVLGCVCEKLSEKNGEIEKEVVKMQADKQATTDLYKKKNEELMQSLVVREALKAMRENLQQTKEKIAAELPDINEYTKEVAEVDPDALRKELSEMSPKDVLEGKVKRIDDEISKLQKAIRDKQAERETLVKVITKAESKIEKLIVRQVIIDELIPLFGKKGIPKSEAKNGAKRITKRMNETLDIISNHTLKVRLDGEFVMNVNVKDARREDLTIAEVSDGQENLVNMVFVLSLGQEISKGKVSPLFIVDDVLRSNERKEDAKAIVGGLLHLQKAGKIKQLFMSSSSLLLSQYKNEVDKIVKCDAGSIKAK